MPNKGKESPTPPAVPGTKVRWCGKTENLIMTNGKVYEILSIEKEWYRVIDDSGEDYLYPPEMFKIIVQRERMMKLMTPLGEISVRIDGREIPYTFRKWDNYGSCEDLDGRYSIEIVFEPDGLEHIIACCLRPNQKIDYFQDSGERLICKSFYSEDEKIKLSVGTYGDNRYIYDKEGKLVRASEFDYDNGFSAEAGEYALTYELLPDTRTRQFWFGIAWLENCTEENEHHTWYGVGTWYDIMKERSGNPGVVIDYATGKSWVE